MDYSSFAGKVAIITGGGGETGGGTALSLARWGASIAIIDISESRLEEVVRRYHDAGFARSKICARVGDVRKPGVVRAFVDEAVEKFGKLDMLFNVVGTKRFCNIHNSTWDDWMYVIDGNIKTTFLVTQACLEHLKATKGVILNMSSVAGQSQAWPILPYSVIKAATDHFTRALSAELAPHGVRVNAVSPGVLYSRYNMRFGGMYTSEEDLRRYTAHAEAVIPMGRCGYPQTEVVPVCVHLLSDRSDFMTGTVIPINGGYNNTCVC